MKKQSKPKTKKANLPLDTLEGCKKLYWELSRDWEKQYKELYDLRMKYHELESDSGILEAENDLLKEYINSLEVEITEMKPQQKYPRGLVQAISSRYDRSTQKGYKLMQAVLDTLENVYSSNRYNQSELLNLHNRVKQFRSEQNKKVNRC